MSSLMMMSVEEEQEARLIILYLKSFLSSFQFDPTEEELKQKLQTAPFTFNLTKDVHLYDLNPREFKANFIPNGVTPEGLNEYYFFTPRDRRYAVGHGAERVDRTGYWESPGQVMIPIYESNGVEIGSKKVLAFHEGQQPNGERTPWVMHEYKAKDAESTTNGTTANVRAATTAGVGMQLNEWVICKIYKNAEEKPAATTPPSAAASATLTAAAAAASATPPSASASASATLTAAAASASATPAAENRLNIIENTATRVENTATRELNTSIELVEGSDVSYDPERLIFWNSKKCLGNVFKRAEE